jgi:nitrous oxidase accessory protein
MKRWFLLLTLAAMALIPLPSGGQKANLPYIVSPDGPYTSIQSALSAADDGDTIEVRGGTYLGPLVVDKSVRIEGVDWPVIDGGGQGTVVTLAAPEIVFRGFEVRGSGTEPDRDHAGITLTAPRVVVENNRLRDVLFGIFVAQADEAIVRGNDVTSKTEYEIGRKGDGIRLWYSQGAIVETNHIHAARDVVIWYSQNVIVRDNLIEQGRYGIHLMYCDGAVVERNRVLNNSVGIYTMYSKDTIIRANDIRRQHGPSGYALGFKDADNVEVSDNLLVDNHGGAFLDGTPYTPQGFGRFHDNIFAFNNVGVILMPAVHGNDFTNNTFWENIEQMAVQGGGQGENDWQGNYWSDYAGFDANGDGVGDIPYRAERLFENLTDREPRLRILLYSPAVQAIEFAATAFPIVRPQPKLTDSAPRVLPAALPVFVHPTARHPFSMALASLLVMATGGFVVATSFAPRRVRRQSLRRTRRRGSTALESQTRNSMEKLVIVRNVSKHYKKVTALEDVTFEAAAGEAIALWGENGAGKTTLLKAILGLIAFEGEIQVGDYLVRGKGKQARSLIGYVPQEFVFYEMSAQETLAFYARLKKTPPERISALLERLGLVEHAGKAVSALSGGLRQRLALAVALLADPPILLLDEPMANLDARARREYLALLVSLHRAGKTMLFASHRFEEVAALADRVLIIEEGHAVETLSPEELRTRYLLEVEMSLWVAPERRAAALDCLQAEGLSAHFNGRGTVVVRLPEANKMRPLQILNDCAIPVLDFAVEEVHPWN